MKRKCLILAVLAVLMSLTGCKNRNDMKSDPEKNAVMEAILGRTSIRNYDDRHVEADKVESLLRAGMAAPSAKNVQPWEFVVVNERPLLDSMADGLPYAKMLTQASLAIVVCGNSEASALWMQDCSAAAQNILLAAHSFGLGTVWTAAYPYEDRISVVSSALGLPENIVPLCVIPVGYPAKEHTTKDKWDMGKVKYNKW